MEDPRPHRRLLIGYGDIAQRLTKISRARSIPVSAMRRTSITDSSVKLFIGDATQSDHIRQCLAASVDDTSPWDIVVTLTPDSYSEQGYRGCYLACAIALAKTLPMYSPNSRVLFVSSTSVYGQDNGEWVTETSECSPKSNTAKVLVEAEQVIAAAGFDHCNLRFSGIYGPGRARLITSVQNGNFAPMLPVHWTNRIHADDCAGVIDYLLSLPAEKLPDTVIGTDNLSAPRRLVQKYISSLLGLESPSTEKNQDIPEGPTCSETGKRCGNGLLRELGYELKYPTYKQGFTALIAT